VVTGNMLTKFCEIAPVVFETRERTNKQTDRHADCNTLHHYRGELITDDTFVTPFYSQWIMACVLLHPVRYNNNDGSNSPPSFLPRSPRVLSPTPAPSRRVRPVSAPSWAPRTDGRTVVARPSARAPAV